MNHDALSTYLNDHLAGSTLGLDHARQLEKKFEGSPFGPTMSQIADDVEADRDTLLELMDRLEVMRNPVKAAGAWVAEKAGRVKFSGASSGDAELGTFMALETMSLGVEGKRSLWIALQVVESAWPALEQVDLANLISRAESQRALLEAERRAAASRAFGIEVLTS